MARGFPASIDIDLGEALDQVILQRGRDVQLPRVRAARDCLELNHGGFRIREATELVAVMRGGNGRAVFIAMLLAR